MKPLQVIGLETVYNPYATHGAGIFTYIFGWFLGQMLVNIPYMEHLGKWSNPTLRMASYVTVPTFVVYMDQQQATRRANMQW